jgi:DNA-binding transcriptional regulator YbjK
MTDVTDETAGRLVDAAGALLAAGGVKAVTARAVAAAASSSASAVNYYFGGREGLLLACFAAHLEQEREWRGRALHALVGLELEAAHFPDWLAALLSQRGVQRSAPGMVERELFLQAERMPALLPIARIWETEIQQFLQSALLCFGLDLAHAEPLAELYHGASDLRPAETDDTICSAWITVTVRRFACRLLRLPDNAGDWRAMLERAAQHDALSHASPESLPPAAGRILDGAIQLIAREGAAGLTHRALASECNVALSATTHYFASRGAILRAAFEHLYRRMTANTPPAGEAYADMSADELAAKMANTFIADDGAIRPELAALDEMIVAARRDPALSPFALHLMASRGKASIHFLASLRPRPANLSRTDAFLWSLCAMGALSAARVTPRAERRALLERSVRRRIAALLG